MIPPIFVYITLLAIIIAIMLGIPVAFALGGVSLLIGLPLLGLNFLSIIPQTCFGMMTNYVFVAVFLFIFMGTLLERAGVADRLYGSLFLLLGRLKGGLAASTIVMATLFGACTGIVGAGVLTIGLIALPGMLGRGYDKELATGSIMCGGGLGVIIPPSIMLIMYGSVGAVNIAQLFVAGIIPGLLFSSCYIAYVLIRCHFQPEKGPSIPKEERAKVSRRDLAAMMGTSLVPPLFLIFSVIGTIFLGIAAPSEAAAMGSLGAMIVAAAYGKLNWKTLGEAGIEALRITSMVLFIVIAAKMFMAVWLAMGAKMVITSFLTGLPFGPLGVLLVLLIVVLIMGMFTDWIGLIFVLVPIFAPIATNLGYEPLVFGMLFCCTLQISNMTPPFAYSVFYLKSIAPPDVTVADMYRGALPFVALQVIVVFILITFPYLITFLPGIMSY